MPGPTIDDRLHVVSTSAHLLAEGILPAKTLDAASHLEAWILTHQRAGMTAAAHRHPFATEAAIDQDLATERTHESATTTETGSPVARSIIRPHATARNLIRTQVNDAVKTGLQSGHAHVRALHDGDVLVALLHPHKHKSNLLIDRTDTDVHRETSHAVQATARAAEMAKAPQLLDQRNTIDQKAHEAGHLDQTIIRETNTIRKRSLRHLEGRTADMTKLQRLVDHPEPPATCIIG